MKKNNLLWLVIGLCGLVIWLIPEPVLEENHTLVSGGLIVLGLLVLANIVRGLLKDTTQRPAFRIISAVWLLIGLGITLMTCLNLFHAGGLQWMVGYVLCSVVLSLAMTVFAK